jgi:YD repeat-containing protein
MGRVYQVTSYGADLGGETVLNQVQYAYDGWGNETCEWQALTGQVATSSTPSVQYEYGDGADGTGEAAAYVRLTDVIYPASPGSSNGRDINCGYGPTDAVDDIMSRLATISDSSGPIAAYTYLGADTIASEDLQQPQIELDYSADNFAALDRFSRVQDQVWSSYGSASGNAGTFDGYTYTYDRDGNRTSAANLTAPSLSETYEYDNLDRLTSSTRNDGYDQSWTLDSLGNFVSYSDNSGTQNRTTDPANEITGISGTEGAATPVYDLAGNMTTTPDPSDATTALNCTYDAWSRLVQVSSGGTILAQYQYDGTGRRIAGVLPAGEKNLFDSGNRWGV